jgi:hypothetical protein
MEKTRASFGLICCGVVVASLRLTNRADAADALSFVPSGSSWTWIVFAGIAVFSGIVNGLPKGQRRGRKSKADAPQPKRISSRRAARAEVSKPASSDTCRRLACATLTPAQSVSLSALPTLEELSWDDFELLVAERYRRLWYEVEVQNADGGDGGYDVRASADGETTLVQCKHRPGGGQIGVSTVRELLGVRQAAAAHHAALVTTGTFTRDARAFAEANGLIMIDGETLRAEVSESRFTEAGDLLDLDRWLPSFCRNASIRQADCPYCHSVMALRSGRHGAFWGCTSYPRCRGKRKVRARLS